MPSWYIRRRVIAITITFCMMVIIYILYTELDTEAAQTAMSMAFLILGSTVSSYVFGAAWQDISLRKETNCDSQEN